MARLFKVLAVLCLLLGATAAPTAPSQARQYDDLAADAAVQAVRALIARINADTAAVKAHRFTPAYYAAPCTPTKEDGERSLAPFRQQRRAYVAEIAALKARMATIESFSSSAVVLANNGWNVHDQNRFRALDQAFRSLASAIAAKEAELDAMPELPCRRTTPPPQPPRDPNGALTAGEEAQFDDFPLPQPRFDDPVTMPKPPRFCSFAERRAWMDSVYWPTVKRAEANAVKAIDTFGKAEQRLRDVRANDRPDSPRIALAEQSVRFWEAEKNRRMAEHQRLLAIDVPNPVDCGTPSTTTGGVAVTPPRPPVTTPPPADGPAVAPPPLPPGVVRPQLERTTVPRLPTRFCSEREKQAFLVDVYHPAAEAASKNALKTSSYRARLSQLIVEAGQSGDAGALAALRAEYDAFKPIAEEADALAQRLYRMRDEILRIPVVDCGKPEQPRTSPPPTEESGMAPVVVTAGPIREAPGDGPARPKLPPPPLARPQFERVPEIVPPARFCSAYERNDFLNNVYNPAVAAALANARTAQAHQARLNAMFTEYMKANSEHWAAVRAERDAFEAITNEALAKSGALNDLYLKIMAIPIVDCGPRSEPPPSTPLTTPTTPVVDGPPTVPTDGPGGSTELGGVIFPNIDLPPLPEDFCQGERQAAEGRAETARRTVEDNEQRIREYRGELEEEVRYYTERGDAKRLADARSKLEALKDIEARVARDRAAVEAYKAAIGRVKDYCRPKQEAQGGAGVTPRQPPPAHDFLLPTTPPNLCEPKARARYIRALQEAHDVIDEAFGELEDYLFATMSPGAPDISAERKALYKRLDEYDGQLAEIEDRLDELAFGALRTLKACPPPTDGPATEPKKPCPPRQGRDPINVGPNSKVGSGAQLRSKLGGMATGALLGALGAGGGGGGGGEPQLWTCKIKESEMTLFEDPVTGVSIRVGAKRAKDKIVVFTDIVRSPDKGTFQTAFLERPSTGEVMAPQDIGPCDLWGEWKLTVSWTKSTYVDGQLVKRESGGWSEGGFFRIPGVLSKVDAPDGFWKRMGFSNASHGVRDMAAIFNAPPGGGPLTYVVHVTRPKGDPVTTVPFVLTLTEGPGGVFTVARGEDPPCPPEKPWETTSVAPPPMAIAGDPGPGGREEPPPPPRESGGSLPPPPAPRGLQPWPVDYLPTVQAMSEQNREAMRQLIDEADKNPCPDGYKRALDRIRWSMDEFRRMVPKGSGADLIREEIDAALRRLGEMEDEVLRKMAATSCPAGAGGSTGAPGSTTSDAPESILDDVEDGPPVLTGGAGPATLSGPTFDAADAPYTPEPEKPTRSGWPTEDERVQDTVDAWRRNDEKHLKKLFETCDPAVRAQFLAELRRRLQLPQDRLLPPVKKVALRALESEGARTENLIKLLEEDDQCADAPPETPAPTRSTFDAAPVDYTLPENAADDVGPM